MLTLGKLLPAQRITVLNGGGKVNLRGLSAVSDEVIWVSGSSGTVGLTTNGGTSWKWIQVPYYEKSDFRDIEAFNDREAVILGVTNPALILRTIDGGQTWSKVFEDTSGAAFLDAMDFSGDRAMAIGDPIEGKIYTVFSANKGESWNRIQPFDVQPLPEGEAFFAASGTNLKWYGKQQLAMVSGGHSSNLYTGGERFSLLINQGGEFTGANSIAINPADSNQAYIVGGDFSHDTLRYRNSVAVQLHPFAQTVPDTAPHGYRSCVEYLDEKKLVSCGTTGVDYSVDSGMNWKLISRQPFHVCQKAKTGKYLFLAGPMSTIGRLSF